MPEPVTSLIPSTEWVTDKLEDVFLQMSIIPKEQQTDNGTHFVSSYFE